MTVKKSLTALAMIGFMMGVLANNGVKAMMKEEEEMDLGSCVGFWHSKVWIGDFKQSDLPILAKQIQKFKLNPLEGTTTEKMIENIQSLVSSGQIMCTKFEGQHFSKFANIIENNLYFLEKEKQVKLFIDGILFAILRKLTY